MDPDMIMTIGLGLGIFAFPALVTTVLNDGATNKVVGFFALVAVAVMVIAALQKPGGYSLLELPGVFVSTIGRMF